MSAAVWLSACAFTIWGFAISSLSGASCSRAVRPCEYICHCLSKSLCERIVTDSCQYCHGGCQKGWGGPMCQRENILLDTTKETFESSRHWPADKPALAFDASRSTHFWSHIAKSPYLIIKFKEPLVFWNLKLITNDQQKRKVSGFQVDVSIDMGFSKPRRCYKDNSSHRQSTFPITCPKPLEGQYMRVQVPGKTELIISEMEIYNCSDYWYGSECTELCNCRTRAEVCNKVTGACRSGCPPGFHGNDCQEECPVGRYGLDCALHCGKCVTDLSCDKSTGVCFNGCAPGFAAPLCNERVKCSSGLFSEDCSGRCGKCLHSQPCDMTTGTCPHGCEPGFLEPLCQTRNVTLISGDGERNFSAPSNGSLDNELKDGWQECKLCQRNETEKTKTEETKTIFFRVYIGLVVGMGAVCLLSIAAMGVALMKCYKYRRYYQADFTLEDKTQDPDDVSIRVDLEDYQPSDVTYFPDYITPVQLRQ